MNIHKLMKQAQQMQERMQRELAELVIESASGGGMVKVRMTGHKHVLAIEIDREVIDPEDPGMLQDLVLAAINEASRQVDEAMQSRLGALAPGMPGLG